MEKWALWRNKETILIWYDVQVSIVSLFCFIFVSWPILFLSLYGHILLVFASFFFLLLQSLLVISDFPHFKNLSLSWWVKLTQTQNHYSKCYLYVFSYRYIWTAGEIKLATVQEWNTVDYTNKYHSIIWYITYPTWLFPKALFQYNPNLYWIDSLQYHLKGTTVLENTFKIQKLKIVKY